MGETCKVNEILAKKNVSVEKIEEHIKNYTTNDSRAIMCLVNTFFIIIAVYTPIFLFPNFKLFWPIWIMIRAFLFIRIYILFHDCTHGSFFTNQNWNWILGVIASGPSVTPFRYWQKGHLYHHQHVGDRGAPDGSRTILFTTKEYNEMPFFTKLLWRVIRDPVFFFTFVPSFQFLIQYRYQRYDEPHSHVPTLYMIVHYSILYYINPTIALLDFIGLCIGTTIGFLLFHWQHEVNSAYWVESNKYNLKDASLLGCTFLMVPEWLKWSTLGIEYHHIHHLSTKVPCYNLRYCHEEAPQDFWGPVTIVDGKKAFAGALNSMWNVEKQKFETFGFYETLLEKMGLKGCN